MIPRSAGRRTAVNFRKGRVLVSPLTKRRYKVGDILGQGGFGRAFQATAMTVRGRVIDEVCLKTTRDQISWQRESYFGELLGKAPRAIRTLDSFPVMRRINGKTDITYCLVLELARHGTVADYLGETGRPWNATRAVREIVALLKMLDQLHGASATHRDLTPMNVFVCGNGTLKLGDFGTARHQLAGRPARVEAFNPEFVTAGFVAEAHRYWTTTDDVYQMGQLLAMLMVGDASRPVTWREVAALKCDVALKKTIRRAIGPRTKRHADAFELLLDLRGDAVNSGPLKSLRGRAVVFAGPLSISRFDATVAALQCGARVSNRVSGEVDVVVQGKQRSRSSGTGHRSRKLSRAEQLVRRGHRVHIIGEKKFFELVGL